MSWIIGILRKWNMLPKGYDDAQIDASIEDAYRDHAEAVDMVHKFTANRRKADEQLRRSIHIARAKTQSIFADFEQSVQQAPPHGEERFPNA